MAEAKRLPGSRDRSFRLCAVTGSGDSAQPGEELIEAAERFTRLAEGLQREIELFPVVGAEQHPADFAAAPPHRLQIAQRVEVSERLGHFLAIDHQMGAMKPVVDPFFSGCGFALGNFIFVMREHIVDAAGVDIEGVAEIFARHCAAFDMPAGTSPAPRGIPGDVAVEFVHAFQRAKSATESLAYSSFLIRTPERWFSRSIFASLP